MELVHALSPGLCVLSLTCRYTLYGDGDGNKSHSDFFCLRIAYLYISEPEVSYCHIFSPCSENYTSVEV